jgi:hypothetical protein
MGEHCGRPASDGSGCVRASTSETVFRQPFAAVDFGRFSQMTSKSWRILTIAYLIFYVLVIAIERHGFGRGPMSPIERVLIAPLLWCFAGYGLSSGFVSGRFSTVDRTENPVGFWSSITFMVLFGLFLFCWGIRDALR